MDRKMINLAEFRALLKNNMSIMFGGLYGIGTPQLLINEIYYSGVKNLTMIGNDIGSDNNGISILIKNKQVSKIITSQISSNPNIYSYIQSGDIDIELVPQSTLSERIHCGGHGFGGFLTTTGINSFLEKDKKKVKVNNITYLIELPLHADLAIIQANTADSMGNLSYEPNARNLNPLMASAASTVVALCNKIDTDQALKTELIMTPSVFVDYILCYPNIEHNIHQKNSSNYSYGKRLMQKKH